MDPIPPPAVDVRRAADRPVTRTGWLDSRHSFSFGAHYDPADTHHGLLLAHNEDVVAAGAGYDTHPHRDLEIVTWVLDGVLAHRDSTGRGGEIGPGLVQRLSAGSGVLHSERSAGGPVHFVQMWVVPDEPGRTPDHAQRDVTAELAGGELVPVASGLARHADAAVRLANRAAGLHAARLPAGGSVTLPDAPYVHLFVARGSVDLEGLDLGGPDVEGAGPLAAGDAVRLSAAGGRRLRAAAPAEVLAWEMHGSLGG